MARDDLTSRAAVRFELVERQLRAPLVRWTLVALVLGLTVALQVATGDTRWAWLGALPSVLAGAVGGVRWGVAVAAAFAVATLSVDLGNDLDAAHIVSLAFRTATLIGLGVTGAVIQRIEGQRDSALVRSATEDPVTGLLNVRAFYDGLRDLARDGHTFSILLADVVGMNQLNERHGHPMGTEALRALGHAIRRSVKHGDLVARVGGDEVAIALLGADPDGARAAAARLGALLADEELTLPDGTSLEVHVYFGIATYPQHAADGVTLLRAANHAVSDAKGRGPDQVAVSTDGPGDPPDHDPGNRR